MRNWVERAHRRLREIDAQLERAEYIGDKQLVKELRKEAAELGRELNEFYSDPITQSISL